MGKTKSMPRQSRIQFEGAIYYCNAATLPGQCIAGDDVDRDAFEGLLAELIAKTGWKLFAWALLATTYHLVFRTPQPNLVKGMGWLQNSWVKHFNTRHHRSGSLFAGRYRNWLVDEEEFLPAIIDQVHLAPFHAGLTRLDSGLARYRWCSLRDYLLPQTQRRPWAAATEGLRHLGYGDSSDARSEYLIHLESIANSPEQISGFRAAVGLPAALRGWCLGSSTFRKKVKAQAPSPASDFLQLGQAPSHGHSTALQILKAGLDLEGLTWESLETMSKSDWRKRAIGRAIRRITVVPAEWIAANLNMGVASRAAQLVGEDPNPAWGKGWQRALALVLTLDRAIRNEHSSEFRELADEDQDPVL